MGDYWVVVDVSPLEDEEGCSEDINGSGTESNGHGWSVVSFRSALTQHRTPNSDICGAFQLSLPAHSLIKFTPFI